MTNYSDNDILDDILRVSRDIGCSPSIRQYQKLGKYSSGLAIKRFGKWSDVLSKVGLELKERTAPNKIEDKDVVLQDIRRVANKLGATALSQSQYFQHGNYSDGPLIRLFGSVAQAFDAADLDKYKTISKKAIIEDMQKVAIDGRLSSTQYSENGQYSLSTISYTFGSFGVARDKAGLTKSDRADTTDKLFLLSELIRFFNTEGRCPSKADMGSGYPSDKTYYKAFPGKSWSSICSLAGLESASQHCGLDGHWYDSAAECKIANIFYRNFITYEPHKLVCENRKWTCDFYLSDSQTWVEYDGLGEFRKSPEKFQEKISYYKKHNYNYIVIKDDKNLLETLGLKLSGELIIKIVEFSETIDFLERVHYIGRAPRGTKYSFGAFIDAKLVGVVTFGNSANPSEKYLCLTRMAYLDVVRKKNFGSRFLSCILRQLKLLYSGPIVSWSDPRYHNGGLYKACNFQMVNNKKRKDYIYIDDNGNEYHKSICRVPAGESESDRAIELNLTKVEVPAKDKWIYHG